MRNESESSINVEAEVERLFDASSRPTSGAPRFVLMTAQVAAGKTTIRKVKFVQGNMFLSI
jgi:hypothetical protein